MQTKYLFNRMTVLLGLSAVLSLGTTMGALAAYNGQHCKEPGVCWEPEPGMPEKLAGSKYDVKGLEDPREVAKQSKSETAMEARNAKRVQYFKKTGKWVYDVDQIPN